MRSVKDNKKGVFDVAIISIGIDTGGGSECICLSLSLSSERLSPVPSFPEVAAASLPDELAKKREERKNASCNHAV